MIWNRIYDVRNLSHDEYRMLGTCLMIWNVETYHYYLFIHRKQREVSKLEAIQLDEEVERIQNESQTKLQVQVCTCTCTCTY